MVYFRKSNFFKKVIKLLKDAKNRDKIHSLLNIANIAL